MVGTSVTGLGRPAVNPTLLDVSSSAEPAYSGDIDGLDATTFEVVTGPSSSVPQSPEAIRQEGVLAEAQTLRDKILGPEGGLLSFFLSILSLGVLDPMWTLNSIVRREVRSVTKLSKRASQADLYFIEELLTHLVTIAKSPNAEDSDITTAISTLHDTGHLLMKRYDLRGTTIYGKIAPYIDYWSRYEIGDRE